MAKIMQMPKLSDTMKEGVVAGWLIKEGAKVKSGAPVLEIETDKATMEYEATASGVLLKILVGDGETCALQAPIAVIGKEGEDWQAALDAFNSKQGSPASKPAASEPEAPSKTEPKPSQPTASAGNTGSDSRVKASPLAKKIAAEKGINLDSISGSGPGGRIVQRDLEGASASASPARSSHAQSPVEKIPLTNMRKTIATRLNESVQTAPHFYLTVSLNMDSLLAWRKSSLQRLNKGLKPDQKAVRFSVNDLMIQLVAKALAKHPEVNASWQGDHIAQYRDVHMGMAVALPTGLMTPVIRNADKASLLEIASETQALAKKAKDGKLKPDDYQGGTFTISNLGMAGIESFTAIINPPQAAILAVGSAVPTPVVDASGSVVVETRMKVTLSCDHRVIDGAVGSEFLKTLKLFIEDPVSAFLL